MIKTVVALSPAQASAFLAAYHVLDEITTHMEEHDLDDSQTFGCAIDAMNSLGYILDGEDTIWDDDAVVLKGEE